MYEIALHLPFNGFQIKGHISLPVKATSLIIFSPGFGNSHSENVLAQSLQQAGFGTLQYVGLYQDKKQANNENDIRFLSQGVETSMKWLHQHSEYCSMDLAFFASAPASAVALNAVTSLGTSIKTMVILGDCPDDVKRSISQITCPILIITDESSPEEWMASKDSYPKNTSVELPGASSLLEKPVNISEVCRHTVRWYHENLSQKTQSVFA